MNDAPGPPRGDLDSAMRDDVAMLGRRVAELERQLAVMQTSRPDIAEGAAPVPPPPFAAAPPPLSSPITRQPGDVSVNPLSAGSPEPSPSSRAPAFPLLRNIAAAPSVHARASLENRIGSQVFNRVGIVALLLAATWFLKLAIASGWIGPTGRVLVGLVAGAALVWWSERFRRKGLAVFSYSLKAIGSGVLYLALWAAFQLYHLLPPGIALAAMILVTAWNGWMAWAQNAELLGGYALAGALATPKLLSTGGNHETFLFTYLLAVDLLCVLLVRLKGWVRLLPWVFLSTIGYFIGWYSRFYTASGLVLTSLFALLIFAVFQIPVFVAIPDTEAQAASSSPHRRAGRSFNWSSLTTVFLPLADAAFVSLAMYSLFEDAHHHNWQAWLMVVLAALYLGLVRLPQPAVTAGVHLSLAVVFLSVAIPLKATGEWITIAWLVEGVSLLAIALRPVASAVTSQTRLLRALASAALLLGWFGAMLRAGLDPASQAFFNARFGTAVAGLAALAITVLLCLRVQHDIAGLPPPAPRSIAAFAVVAFNVLAIAAVVREIVTVWSRDPAGDPDQAFKQSLAISAFLMVYGAALLTAGFWRRTAFLRWQGLLLIALTIIKIFLWDTRNLAQGYRIASFLGLGVLLMAISFVYQKDLLSLRAHEEPAPLPADHGEGPA